MVWKNSWRKSLRTAKVRLRSLGKNTVMRATFGSGVKCTIYSPSKEDPLRGDDDRMMIRCGGFSSRTTSGADSDSDSDSDSVESAAAEAGDDSGAAAGDSGTEPGADSGAGPSFGTDSFVGPYLGVKGGAKSFPGTDSGAGPSAGADSDPEPSPDADSGPEPSPDADSGALTSCRRPPRTPPGNTGNRACQNAAADPDKRSCRLVTYWHRMTYLRSTNTALSTHFPDFPLSRPVEGMRRVCWG